MKAYWFIYRVAAIALAVGLMTGAAQAVLVAEDAFLIGSDPGAGEYLGWPSQDGSLDPPPGNTPQAPVTTGFSAADPWNRTDRPNGTRAWRAHETGLDSPFLGGEAGGSVRYKTQRELSRNVYRPLDNRFTSRTFYMSLLLELSEPDGNFLGDIAVGFTSSSVDQDDDPVSGTNAQNAGFRVGFAGDGNEMDLIYRSRTRVGGAVGPVTVEDQVIRDGINVGQTYLVVLKGELDAVGGGGLPNDRVSIWLDPMDVASEFNAGTPTLIVNDFSMTTAGLSGLFMEADGITGETLFDELRLGTTWEDVTAVPPFTAQIIPEAQIPAMLAIAAAALLLVVTNRRRVAVTPSTVSAYFTQLR